MTASFYIGRDGYLGALLLTAVLDFSRACFIAGVHAVTDAVSLCMEWLHDAEKTAFYSFLSHTLPVT